MSFVHENADELADLVQIVAGERGLRRSIVEKDYWVTHTLWALSKSGLEFWFKGGPRCRRASASSSASPKTST